MSDALTAAIAEIRSVTADSADVCEGDRWTGRDFTNEQGVHYPGPTGDAIAEILNAVIDERLAAPRLSACVEVKPLQWEYDAGWHSAGDYEIQAAKVETNVMWNFRGAWCRTVYPDVDAAKAGAQAHHDKRIRSALTVTPKIEQCVEVKPGYGFECYYETRVGDEVHVRYAPLSEALTIRTVEDARREALADVEALPRSTNNGCGTQWVRLEEVREALFDTPAPSREKDKPMEFSPPNTDYEAVARMAMDGDADPIGTARLNYPHLFPAEMEKCYCNEMYGPDPQCKTCGGFGEVEVYAPAPPRETKPSPEPVAWGESFDGGKSMETISLTKTRHHTYPLFATPQPDKLREPKVVTIGYHADELRQAKAEAWERGFKDGFDEQAHIDKNPYAAPDEGGE